MSAPAPTAADPIEASVRTKVKVAIGKSLTPELTELIEAKLAQSFPTGTGYKSAFRTLTNVLKPKSDALKPDSSIAVPISVVKPDSSSGEKKSGGKKGASAAVEAKPAPAVEKRGPPSADEFTNVIADLQSKKLSIGKLFNHIEMLEKNKKTLLNEAESSASVAAPLAQQQLESEYARAQKARIVGLITQRIKAAKDAIATGAGGLENPTHWAEVGDASMELYYQAAPNTAYLNQALKVYSKVESLSSEYLNSHPSFYLKRAAIHIIMEDFETAVEDLKTFASKKPITMPPQAIAASAAPTPESYQPLATPRINAIAAYVHTVSNLVEKKFHVKDDVLRQLLREIPNPSREQLQREMTLLALLKEGVNEGKGIVVRVLGKIDQTSLYALQKNTNPDGTPLPLLSVHESLESSFKTPKSYIVMDSDGHCCALSLYNVMGEEKKQKPIKQNDMLILLDPLVKEVELNEGGKKGKYRSLQVQNPNYLLIKENANPRFIGYSEEDIVPVE